MPSLQRDKIDGRWATIAYLLNDQLVDPDQATTAIAKFDNGEVIMLAVTQERSLALPVGEVITMPFADYEDFADCVEKNPDKDDPKAFCGWLKHRIEGSDQPPVDLSYRDKLALTLAVANYDSIDARHLEWDEGQHPRADDGKFSEGAGDGGHADGQPQGSGTDGGGGGSVSAPAATTHARPGADPAASRVADSYNEAHGLPPVDHSTYIEVSQPRARDIADAYDALPADDQDNPKVKEAYAALSTEIQQQWDHIVASGMTLEPWTQDGQPYQTSTEMVADVKNNKHMYFYTGGEPHPLIGAKSKDKTGLSLNEKFRAVHDYFGHAAGGYGFGPRGEENAWRSHSQMLTFPARRALTTETRGQNSWVNFGRQNYEADGTHKNLPPGERPYATQKVALLPDEYVLMPGEQPKSLSAYRQRLLGVM